MATFTNNSKTSAFSPTNEAANAASFSGQKKPGQGYQYDSYLTYDEGTDPLSNNAVLYDGIGSEPSWTNEAKS